MLKFAKPDEKKQLIIDIGFKCYITQFSRAKSGAQSVFVTRLRKLLRGKRLTSVRQVGTDRIIEFSFNDGSLRMFLEFFAVCQTCCYQPQARTLTEHRVVTLLSRMSSSRFLPSQDLYRKTRAAKLRPLVELILSKMRKISKELLL